ncbi:hypothetical protein MCGE09_00096 [Thaumarchaeota archaeon SCGC AB-539-E09]|nr:hypothetical protein MCGE09_00096 [Thaumarchaeota archaeon SCGC AB-539-E09]
MKCPKCGRFSKELLVTENDGSVVVYSNCAYCGKILMDEERGAMSSGTHNYTKYLLVVLLFLIVLLSGLSWVLYDRLSEHQKLTSDLELRFSELYDNYLVLINTTTSVKDYYEELQGMYNALKKEYENLNEIYVAVSNEKLNVEKELYEIINFKKSIIFEDNKTIYLSAVDNITLTYDSPYAGYISVNYTSSGEIVFWFGSPVTDEKYYARYPAFPNTTKQGSIKIPVCSITYVYIINPNNELDVTINLDIKYFY